MPEPHLKAILELGARFGPHPTKNIEFIVSSARELLGCDCAAYGRIEEGSRRIRLSFSCNLPPRPSPVREAIRTLCRNITFDTGSPSEAVSNGKMSGHEFPPGFDFNAFLGFPVQLDGTPRGALIAFRKSRLQFVPRDKHLIALLAKDLAIQDAWLTRERSLLKRAAFEKKIEEISTLAMAVDSPASFLDRCMELIGKSMKVDGAFWWEFDPSTRTVSKIAEWLARGRSSQKESLQRVPIGSMPWTADRLMAGDIAPVEDSLELHAGGDRDILQSLGVRSAVAVPLFSREAFFGFIGIEDFDEPRRWAPEEISLLQTAAEIMLRGIENKKLTDELVSHQLGLQRLVDERTAALADSNERLGHEVEAHRRTIAYLKSREVELRNHNRAFTDLSDRLSLLLQEKGQSIAEIEALFADRIRSRFKKALTDKKSIALGPDQVETIRHDIDGIASQLKSERFGAYSGLTAAEIKVAELVRLGLSGKEISGVLAISDRTVQVHCLKIREKLGIKNKKLNLKGYLMSL